jgi:alpha-L-rhamnosidase
LRKSGPALSKPRRLRTEFVVDPVAVDRARPRLSWVLGSGRRGERPAAFQVVVSSGEALARRGRGDVWDSGRREGSECGSVEYGGPPLESFRHFFWRVRWWSAAGERSSFSEIARFGSGALRPGDWTARWITLKNPPTFRTRGTTLLGDYLGDVVQSHAVYLRKEFDVPDPPVSAVVFVCGLGCYELSLNGRKVGDHVLDPGWTDYAKRALYAGYDLTERLRARNALGVVLGNGRHIPYYGYGPPRLFLELVLRLRDGSVRRVVSDASWAASLGPLRENGLYFGEIYDARREAPGWDWPGFRDGRWKATVEMDGPPLTAQVMPPVRAVRTLRARRAWTVASGARVFDFGQNFAGWVRLKVRGARGTAVRLRHAELLNEDGSLNTAPNQNAEAADIYILKGRGTEVYEPRFTYHGFRYVEVGGPAARRVRAAVEGRVVHSDLAPTGRFRSSHPLLNRIHANVIRGQRSNLMSIPTDCPQRDERQGWLGDAHLAAEQAAFNFDMAAFYDKFLEDIRLAQRADGSLPDAVPPYLKRLYPADPAWGAAFPILAWLMYWNYGDARVLTRNRTGMKKYVDFLWRRAENGLLRSLGKYGDWCPPGSVAPKKTPVALTSTGFLYHDTLLFARMAAVLGRTAEARRYEARARRIKRAFNRAFLARGEYEGRRFSPVDRAPSQTSQVLALAFGLVPAGAESSVRAALLRSVVDDQDYHLDTGIVGTRYLLDVLTEGGCGQAAFRVAAQTSYPGWGYMIREGATTLWERWENMAGGGMNSHNHIMLGSVDAWFYRALAGLRCLGPGWSRVEIRPFVPAGLRWVRAEFETVRGKLRSAWSRESGVFRLRVEIPVGAEAAAVLPLPADRAVVREGSRTIWKDGRARAVVPGFSEPRRRAGALVVPLSSGRYDFRVTGPTNNP